MPDVDIISDDPDSYMSAVIELFEQKNPFPLRGFDFFKESQKPAEDASSWVARVEAMAIAANVEMMTYEDHIKLRIITGLINDDSLRTKLLKNYKAWSLQKVKEEVANYDATNRVSDAIDKKLMISNQANHVSSYRRDQSNTRQSQYQQPRASQQNYFGGQQRPQSPRPRFPNNSPFQRPRQVMNTNRMNYNLGCRKFVADGRRCNFSPYYQCRRHWPRPPNQMNQIAGDNAGLAITDDGAEDELNMGFVNAVNSVGNNPGSKRYETIGGENWYDIDENGQPIMVDSRATPMVYIHIKYNPTNDTPKRQFNYKTSKALAMPDSGCTLNICSPKFARQCNLIVNEKETTQMYTANGQPLECKGATRALISYFGLVTPVKTR